MVVPRALLRTLANIFYRLTIPEIDTEESGIPGVLGAVPDPLSLFPWPTDNQWRQATIEDLDLPFASHSGITRTRFRVQTRFWWPGVVRDVTDGVRGCAHCNLANATSHEQNRCYMLSCDVPFDVLYLDI
jgi:hypothetical protein